MTRIIAHEIALGLPDYSRTIIDDHADGGRNPYKGTINHEE